MTAYITIADSEIDPESPGTTTLFTKLRDNLIAVTEGASGSPLIDDAALATGAGSLKLLQTISASSSATLDLTTGIDSTYDAYIIEFSNLVFSTTGSICYVLFSTNGGSSFITTSSYTYSFQQNYVDSTASEKVQLSSTPEIKITKAINSTAGTLFSGTLKIHSPSATRQTVMDFNTTYYDNAAGTYAYNNGSAFYNATTSINAVRVLPSAGNVTSGEISLYGVHN